MKDLTKVFIDLSKCTEEERKHIFSLLPKPIKGGDFIINEYHSYLHFDNTLTYPRWYVDYDYYNKQELTYPEFIKLFEGGEDNNGWIKIGEDGKINYNGLMWGVDKSGFVHYFSEGDFIEIGYLTHYQPVQKPLPPKF